MALKDWIKVSKRKDILVWKNKKDLDRIAVFEMNNKGRWKWGFEAPGLDKNFKSKSDALRFAKAYMRTH